MIKLLVQYTIYGHQHQRVFDAFSVSCGENIFFFHKPSNGFIYEPYIPDQKNVDEFEIILVIRLFYC